MSTSQANFGRLDHRLDGWWITGLCCQDMGPYRTQEEARDDLRGVQRFFRETSKEKPRSLFFDVNYAKGQLDLFDRNER